VPRSSVFLAGQAVSMLGDGLALLAVPLLVLQVSRSPLLAVLASLPGSAGYLAAGLPAGGPLDRRDPWHVCLSAASVTMRAFRQLLVPRDFLGRVTASWRLGGQSVTLIGGVLAGAGADILGGDPGRTRTQSGWRSKATCVSASTKPTER
jgi:hypothetical protein